MADPTPLRLADAEEENRQLRTLLEKERNDHALSRAENGRLREELASVLQKNRILAEDATRDRLTGLGNRAVFEDQMELRQHIGPFSLVMIDVDHFKRINDQYGHPIGDRLLHRLGDILRGASHENDICTRIGGEEFAVILCDSDETVAAVFAERLLRNVRDNLVVRLDDGRLVRATVSIGAGQYRGESTGAFYGRIDRALYAAKNAGRNCIKMAE